MTGSGLFGGCGWKAEPAWLRSLALTIMIFGSIAGCDNGEPPPLQSTVTETANGNATSLFQDGTATTRLTFEHGAFPTRQQFLPEIVGAGVGVFDYDGDGDLDVYFLQGGHAVNGPENQRKGNRLFRNNLTDGAGLTFTDVSESAGVNHPGYGMGIATGDVDNDGDVDAYITNFGSNVLYLNQGDGSFSDITGTAGVDDPRWSTSASFADFDGDGLLDLFVTNYVAGSVEHHQSCRNALDQPDYCSPTTYAGTSDSLFRNLGDGRFEDISETSGISAAAAAGLGVVAADFDLDGRTDFFVANDQTANFLWRNLGDGRFEESGLVSGSAYNGDGMAEASMGIAAEDFDGDGDIDLFLTHLNAQSNTLYVNDGRGNFADDTDKARLGGVSLRFTGFGTHWFDVDNDSHLDLFVANGSVIAERSQANSSDFPYAQRNQLFRNNGQGRYSEWRDVQGGPLEALGVSRGSATGDLDNDGDLDVVVNNGNGPAQLLVNIHPRTGHWLGLTLTGRASNRDGAGARVALLRPDAAPLWRRAHSDGSYLSANDSRVHFGFGDGVGGAEKTVVIGVAWPSGKQEQWRYLPIGRYEELVEGSGEPWSPEGAVARRKR